MKKIDYEKSKNYGWKFDKEAIDIAKEDAGGHYVFFDGNRRYSTDFNNLYCVAGVYDCCDGDSFCWSVKDDVDAVVGGLYANVSCCREYFEEKICDLTKTVSCIKEELYGKREALKKIKEYFSDDEEHKEILNCKTYYDAIDYACDNDLMEDIDMVVGFVSADYVPFVEYIKDKDESDVIYTYHPLPSTYAFCKEINSINSTEDKFKWLVANTRVEGENIFCCGMRVSKEKRSIRVNDNRNYWVSFAPTSSREHHKRYYRYIKELAA